MTILKVRRSPPITTAKNPAKTGSIVRITAACVGDINACAHVCTKNANAVASTAVIPTVAQVVNSGGSLIPPGAEAARHMMATVKIWIKVS